MFCTKCGKKINDTDSFCGNCGNKYQDSASKTPEKVDSKKLATDNCNNCDTKLVQIYVGSLMEDNYRGKKMICISCFNGKCPVCKKSLKNNKAIACGNCMSSWNPNRGNSVLQKNSITKDKIKCYKCGSTELTAQKEGYSGGKALGGALLTGGIGLLAGTIGSKKINITCLKCGHKFKPGEDKVNEQKRVEVIRKRNAKLDEFLKKNPVFYVFGLIFIIVFWKWILG